MNIKRNIIFTVEKRKKAGVLIEKNVPIRMRVLFCGNRIEFTTGYRVDLKNWQDQKQTVRNGSTNALKQSASDINAELQYYESEIQKVFKSFEVKEIIPSVEQVKEAFLAVIKKEAETYAKDRLFFEVYDEFMVQEGAKNDWTANTHEKMRNVRKHLIAFNPKLQFSTFNEQGLTAYIEYFKDQKFRNSTIDKQFNFLKWFLNWSFKKGYHSNIAFQTYKPRLKRVPKPVIFLNAAELAKLKNCEIPENQSFLEKVRDVFLFCCYTSFRYSDVYQLRRSNIKGNIIDIVSLKTNKQLLIELNNNSRCILEKYKDIRFKKDKALPVISNQKFNDYLKELGKLAELTEPVNVTYYLGNKRVDETYEKWELLTTHAGRRTFICNGLSLGIPPQVIMKWTGHSDYKAMKPYIDIADDIKASAMDKFNQL